MCTYNTREANTEKVPIGEANQRHCKTQTSYRVSIIVDFWFIYFNRVVILNKIYGEDPSGSKSLWNGEVHELWGDLTSTTYTVKNYEEYENILFSKPFYIHFEFN